MSVGCKASTTLPLQRLQHRWDLLRWLGSPSTTRIILNSFCSQNHSITSSSSQCLTSYVGTFPGGFQISSRADLARNGCSRRPDLEGSLQSRFESTLSLTARTLIGHGKKHLTAREHSTTYPFLLRGVRYKTGLAKTACRSG